MTGDHDKQRPSLRRRLVSADENALWQAFTRSFAPLNRHARREQAAKALKPAEQAVSLRPPLVVPDNMNFAELLNAVDESGKLPAKPALVKVVPPPAPLLQKPKPPSLEGFDHKTAKKLARGQLPIEARLDLHGHRQTEAHIALKSFLVGSQARGLRYVKVITGKGGAANLDERPFDLMATRSGAFCGAWCHSGCPIRNSAILLSAGLRRGVVMAVMGHFIFTSGRSGDQKTPAEIGRRQWLN